jgi:hypothetical protein
MRERRTPVSGRGQLDGVTTRQRDVKRWGAGVVPGFGGLGGTVRRHGTDKMDAGGGKGATRTAWSRGLEETTRRGACGDSRYPLLN